MVHHWYRKHRVEKPLTGFGWCGWAALAVLLGILIPHLNGFDWQYFVLESIWRVWDWPVLYYAVPRMLPLTATLFAPEFGPLTVLPVLIGMGLVPVRFGWWRFAFLLLAAFVVPYVAYAGYVYHFWWFHGGPEWFPSAVSLVLGAACVWWVTRSWFMAGLWIAMLPCALLWYPYERSVLADWLTIPVDRVTGGNVHWPLPGYAVMAMSLAGSIWWGVRMRGELLQSGKCKMCGYQLDGLLSKICPECGGTSA